MKKLIVMIAFLSCAAGCMNRPNYFYEAGQSDPVLVFSSDFINDTFFSVNIDPSSNNSCQKFMLAGNIHNDFSLGSLFTGGVTKMKEFVVDKSEEFSIRVPADQVVAVKAFFSSSGGGWTTTCGPLYASFTPEKGETYKVNMNKKDKIYCNLSLAKAGDSPSPVKAVTFETCN